MLKSYRDVLRDPNISLSAMTEYQSLPEYLYKYQSFYSEDGKENRYWRQNIRGAFHLSLGSEFEDYNDCRPYMDKNEVCEIIEDFMVNCSSTKLDMEVLNGIREELEKVLTHEYFESIMANYRNQIRIGCFTVLSDNMKMWEKYANNKTGFCLQYSTEKSELFKYSTLPVLYSTKPYNSSLSLASQIILELRRISKGRSEEEQLKIYESIYQKSLKTGYIPLFIKEAGRWSFEQEYRMFLLKNRNTQIGMLGANEVLDGNSNINLSEAITAIYLGENFDNNVNYETMKEEIIQIATEMKIRVFQKKGDCGRYINEVIL